MKWEVLLPLVKDERCENGVLCGGQVPVHDNSGYRRQVIYGSKGRIQNSSNRFYDLEDTLEKTALH